MLKFSKSKEAGLLIKKGFKTKKQGKGIFEMLHICLKHIHVLDFIEKFRLFYFG